MLRRVALSLIVTGMALAAGAQGFFTTGDGGRAGRPADMSRLNFTRVIYDSEGGYLESFYYHDGRMWARWETDFPEGDDNFMHRLGQLTRIKTNPMAHSRTLSAPDLGDFPLLYMSDPGFMTSTPKEHQALARYLTKGGFLWVDDFWGDAEWQQFENFMRQVLPNRSWQLITTEHPIFHTVFDINQMPQIPAVPFARPGGPTAEGPDQHKDPNEPLDAFEKPQMRAWLDDAGRIMVVATHNTDYGDGWERESYGEWYFETFSTRSYMMGVNIVTYAMTH
jgi:hypothetical protein